MFEAVGRRGRTKVLSAERWVTSSGSGLFFLALLAASIHALQGGKPPPVPYVEKEIDTVKIYLDKKLPPAPRVEPPPPTRVKPPASTTLPKHAKNQVIPPPEPAPLVAPEPPVDAPVAGPLTDATPGGPSGPGAEGSGEGDDDVTGGSTTETTAEVRELDFGDVTVTQRCRMRYPALAMRGQITGKVMVEVTCSTDGRVTDWRWVSGNELFKDAVADCMSQMRYAPQPIPFRFYQPFSFDLK